MEYCLAQVLQKDMGRRLQVGQELIDYISDRDKSHDLDQDQSDLDKMVDGIATTWVNCSNFKVIYCTTTFSQIGTEQSFGRLEKYSLA